MDGPGGGIYVPNLRREPFSLVALLFVDSNPGDAFENQFKSEMGSHDVIASTSSLQLTSVHKHCPDVSQN